MLFAPKESSQGTEKPLRKAISLVSKWAESLLQSHSGAYNTRLLPRGGAGIRSLKSRLSNRGGCLLGRWAVIAKRQSKQLAFIH